MVWGARGSRGYGARMKSELAEQLCVASRMAKIRATCTCLCSSIPTHLVRAPSLPPLPPQGRCPTPNPALLISAGPVAKEKTGDGEGRGTVLRPCGGQSLQISQPNLGPFPPGVCAQQALLRRPPRRPPRRPRSLKRAPQDSGLRRRAFVLRPQGQRGGWALMTDSAFVFVNTPRQRR